MCIASSCSLKPPGLPRELSRAAPMYSLCTASHLFREHKPVHAHERLYGDIAMPLPLVVIKPFHHFPIRALL